MKTCTKCHKEKYLEDFPKGSGAKCRSCRAEYCKNKEEEYAARPDTKIPKSKICKHCNIIKYSDEFSKNRRRKDGLELYCKHCKKEMRNFNYSEQKLYFVKKANEYRKIHEQTPPYSIKGDRTCNKCGLTKSRVEFSLNLSSKAGLNYSCKFCDKLAQAKRRGQPLNITSVQYNEMSQNGCGICGLDGGDRGLAIDHDHKTGKIRGLLCFEHNTCLGKFNDDVQLLKEAIDYLERK